MRTWSTRFQAAGLEPGNGDSFFQDVPLVSPTERGQPTLTIRAGAEEDDEHLRKGINP